jgi:hypothetical protein
MRGLSANLQCEGHRGRYSTLSRIEIAGLSVGISLIGVAYGVGVGLTLAFFGEQL